MIDIEHGALGALEQDPVAAPARFIQPLPDPAGIGRQAGRDLAQLAREFIAIDLAGAKSAQQRIVMQQQFIELARQCLGLEQIANAHGAARDLVLIGGTDAAPGGAEAGFAPRGFAQAVERAMQRQDQCCVVGQQQITRRHRHALLAQGLDLGQQRPGIDHHAIADDRELALAHDAGGQQAQLVGDVADDQRVAGIVAALEADHDIGALRQPVDDLALALVAPLGADDGDIGHGLSPAYFFDSATARPAFSRWLQPSRRASARSSPADSIPPMVAHPLARQAAAIRRGVPAGRNRWARDFGAGTARSSVSR